MRKFLIHKTKKRIENAKNPMKSMGVLTREEREGAMFTHLVKNTPCRRGYIIDMWSGRS